MSGEILISIAAALILWNIITFALYGIDKQKAKNAKRRISETHLLACAFLMGGVGALLGMVVFRHKTRRLKFRLLIPTSIITNASAVAAFVLFIC